MTSSFPYHGDDFCLIHGRENMRYQMGNPIPFCQACEDERERDTGEEVNDAWARGEHVPGVTQ